MIEEMGARMVRGRYRPVLLSMSQKGDGRGLKTWTNRLIVQPVRREPIVFPTTEGTKCKEAMVLVARCATRKYNATDENIYIRSQIGMPS